MIQIGLMFSLHQHEPDRDAFQTRWNYIVAASEFVRTSTPLPANNESHVHCLVETGYS
jgi:hypothetical protein